MAEPRITLAQLKQLRIGSVVNAKQLPPPGKVVRLLTPHGKVYHVTGAKLSYRNGCAIVGDGAESVLLRTRSRLFVAARNTAVLASWLLGVGLLISLLGPSPGDEVSSRLNELNEIQKALRDLDSYVTGQHSTLLTLSDDIQQLKRERASLLEAVGLDRRQVEALLEYQAASQQRRKWLSVGVSFLVGVLSSASATLLLGLGRHRGAEEVDGERELRA